MSPLPGTIGLTRIQGVAGFFVWLGQAINGDFSRWTHAFIVLDDETVYEAQPGGAVITPLSEYDDRKVAYIDWPLTEEQRAGIVAVARELVGVGYNWGTYFYLAAVTLRIPFSAKVLRGHLRRSKKLICSQACDFIYQENGVHLFDDGRKPFDITPGDLARLL